MMSTAVAATFTFHNVSINSAGHGNTVSKPFKFTFHNVSINSGFTATQGFPTTQFTFHNVSINSEDGISPDCSLKIYIP